MVDVIKRQSELVSEAFQDIYCPIIRNSVFDLTLAISEIMKPVGPSGSIIIDLEGRILSIDSGYCEILWRERAELISTKLDMLTHEDDRQRTILRRKHIAASERPEVMVKRYLRPDEAAIWVRNQFFLVKDGLGPDRIVITGGTVSVPRHLQELDGRH